MHLCSVLLRRHILLLLLFWFPPLAVEKVVKHCHGDRDKDHRPRQNCTAAGYSAVPEGFEPTTKVFLFPRNQFSNVSWSSFSVFTQIHEIDLSYNQISALTHSGAPVLPSLGVLRLGFNQLRSVPDHCFSGTPALTELYLHNNMIHSLRDQSFSGLSKLEILDLSDNHIQTLPPLMMHPLTAIETLYLESNKIKVMPDDWFSQKEEVPYLYLSANPWACSCSLGYLHTYLEEYEMNVYIRDGLIISMDVESVICDSPPSLKNEPVIKLEKSDFCRDEESFTYTATPLFVPTTTPPTTTTLLPPFTTPATTPPVTTTPLVPTTPATTSPPTTPPPPPTTTTATTLLPPLTTPTTPPVSTTNEKYETEVYYKVVTWYETFTRFVERADSWESLRGDGRVIKKTTPQELPSTTFTTSRTRQQTSPTIWPTFHSTDPPEAKESTTGAQTSTTIWPTFPANTPRVAEETTTVTPTDAAIMFSTVGNAEKTSKASAVKTRVFFCNWLFISCVLLSVALGFCSLITALKLYSWYNSIYKSLKRIIVGREQVRMVDFCGKVEAEEVKAMYRTVLFVNKEKEAKIGEELIITGKKDISEKVGKSVYRQTVDRVISKVEEIDSKEVVAECKAECSGAVERRGGASKKRYSVILREMSEKDGGETEKCEWEVGGWEVGKGAEPESSWGQWLTQYLPSMPWGVSAPSKVEAEREEKSLSERCDE